MTADQLIEGLLSNDIGFSVGFEENLRRGWRLDQSQATDKYMAMPEKGRQEVCDKAILHVACGFCGAKPGRACGIVLPYNKSLDHYAHVGRWMNYLIDEDLYELFGSPKSPDSSGIDDLL